LPSLLAKETPFNFDEDCLIAFYTLKKALVSAPVVQPPEWNLTFEIMCDASDYAVGAVDEDIATKDISTPTPYTSIYFDNTSWSYYSRSCSSAYHQVSSLLSSGSSYLDNGDTCTLLLLRNNGLDQKGRVIA
jgi:hypothetical protein